MDQADQWDAYVKSFANWDIYYLSGYARSFMLHGDGAPMLLCYEDGEARFCYVVMRQDIADCPAFCQKLPRGRYFDLETPYGYGGPLCDGTVSPASQERFAAEAGQWCREEGIVSQFVRFHPLLGNQELLPLVIEARYMRDTIYMDTTDAQQIMPNMDSKNRNMVRKAVKNGVTVVRQPIEAFDEFLAMYEETMQKNDADDYYTFRRDYFQSLAELADNACIFYAMLDDLPIGGAIMFFNDRYLHYHLAGTHMAYRQYSPSNLLLYEAACWASEQGIQKLHLGGGMAPEDSLFGFKKQFNKNGRLPFAVGRTIFDRQAYAYLLQIRKELDPAFDEQNGFMIQYRR